MRTWNKRGLLLSVDTYFSKDLHSHASIPFCLHIKDNKFRIYFSSRSPHGKSLPYFIDAKIEGDSIFLDGHPVGPLLDLGDIGTFDDSGIMPSCLLWNGSQVYMYYIGWNPQISVSYRLSIGLAISNDGGQSFVKFSKAPILDRALEEPYFNTAPYVIRENDIWRMWYISCTKWELILGHPEPYYHVKYAESLDGINWVRKGIVCIDYDESAKAIGRPCIVEVNNLFKYNMYFSYRNVLSYRTEKWKGYQIGFAVSDDAITWLKKYDEVGIGLSDYGWDSMMMEYCHVFKFLDRYFMLYNGNDFGKQGFGYAVCK